MYKHTMPALALVFCAIINCTTCHVFLGPDPDNSPQGIFDRIWTDFNETYALFDERGINWNDIRKIYYPQIQPDMSSFELFRVCANMVNSLQDPHVYLRTPFGISNLLDHDPDDEVPFSLNVIQTHYLNDGGKLTGGKRLLYGTFKSNYNIGYIHIDNFHNDFSTGLEVTQAWAKEIDTIIAYLKNTEALVLDVRSSKGGLGSNMDYIASRFISAEKDYLRASTKNGPGRNDFSAPLTFTIKPATPRYTKPIVLLTNNKTISASEWFALALLTQNHVTHAGETTSGAFSPRVIRNLINGWEYTLSIQKVTSMDGGHLEGIGLTPASEHIVSNTWEEIEEEQLDNQLEYALEFLRSWYAYFP